MSKRVGCRNGCDMAAIASVLQQLATTVTSMQHEEGLPEMRSLMDDVEPVSLSNYVTKMTTALQQQSIPAVTGLMEMMGRGENAEQARSDKLAAI
ncbi:hypothetical protein PI124_g14475 [Phytophthora idaei]|nr:hypothetical protein PI124_g14475 [Phytophthora idaei]